jgi:hypothetical protein
MNLGTMHLAFGFQHEFEEKVWADREWVLGRADPRKDKFHSKCVNLLCQGNGHVPQWPGGKRSAWLFCHVLDRVEGRAVAFDMSRDNCDTA